MTIEEINALRDKILSAQRLTEKELFDFAHKANDEGKCFKIAIKIKNSHYEAWHKTVTADWPDHYQEKLSDETLYVTTTDNKAFKSGMGGYSIFASSIASEIRVARGIEQPNLDRIEHAPIEYGVVLEECR